MSDTDTNTHDLSELNVPSEYYSISLPKMKIVTSIKEAMDKNNLSVRKLAEKIGMKHPQIVRVTSGENYNIETLLRILDGLDLEIIIRHKEVE